MVFRPRLEGTLRRLKRGGFISGVVPFSSNERIRRHFGSGAVGRLMGTYFSVNRIGAKTLVMVRRRVQLSRCIEANVGVSNVLADRLLVGVFRRGAPLRSKTIVIQKGHMMTTAYCLPLSSGVRLDGRLKAERETNINVDRTASSLAVVISRRAKRISITENNRLSEKLGDGRLHRMLISTRGGGIISGNGLEGLLGKEIGRRRGSSWRRPFRGRISRYKGPNITSHDGY